MTSLVIGAGISGYGACRYLRAKSEAVRVSERSTLAPSDRAKYESAGVEIKDGGHDISHLLGVSQVIPSPGLPADHILLKAAHERNILIVSEIDLALRDYTGTVIGITGTNGKSTTVGMIDFGLRTLGFSSAPAGNFGDPPTLMIAEGRMPEHLVLELSSYQLEQSYSVHADAVLITSFSNDHLARHGTERDYFAAKWRLVEDRKANTPVIISKDVADTAKRFSFPLPKETVIVSEDDFPDNLTHLEGPHNLRNAAFSSLVISLIKKIPIEKARAAVKDYPGLPHRCQLVGSFGKRKIYNDSKSTNVESTLVALETMKEPVILLMGGIGKGESYSPILKKKNKIALLLTFGPTGPEISSALANEVTVKNFPTLASLFQAFDGIIKERSESILFSPGCASFDEFRNFAHRGDYFTEQIKSLL